MRWPTASWCAPGPSPRWLWWRISSRARLCRCAPSENGLPSLPGPLSLHALKPAAWSFWASGGLGRLCRLGRLRRRSSSESVRPTGDAVTVGVLAVLLLFIAVNLQAGWVYAVDALLIGLLAVGCVSAALGIRGLTVERTMPPEAFEGDPVTVTLRVLVRRGRRFFITLHDAVPGLKPGTVRIPVCDSRHPTAQSYQTVALRRGVFMVEGIDARSSGLAGLFVFRRRLRSPGAMTVFPRYCALAWFPVPGRTGPDIASVHRPDRNGLEVAGVREFRDGDSLRHVHWRSTARRGTLVVREFEHEAADAVALLIDTRAEGCAADRSGQAFEDLVQAAASIVHSVTRSGRPVELIGARGTQGGTSG